MLSHGLTPPPPAPFSSADHRIVDVELARASFHPWPLSSSSFRRQVTCRIDRSLETSTCQAADEEQSYPAISGPQHSAPAPSSSARPAVHLPTPSPSSSSPAAKGELKSPFPSAPGKDERKFPSPFPPAKSERKCQPVGILGGLSTVAAADFLKKLAHTAAVDDGSGESSESMPVFVRCHVQTPTDRGKRRRTRRKKREEGSAGMVDVSGMVESRRWLEESGARVIVLPCHVSHIRFDRISRGCTVPFLHIADCLAGDLSSMDLHPIDIGSTSKIGLIGDESTIRDGFYQRRLAQKNGRTVFACTQGFDVITPDVATMEHAVLPGLAALQRHDIEGARNLLRIAIHVLLVKAVNLVVLASHDMASAFAPEDPLLEKCIDPIDALSRATVNWVRKHQ